MPSLVQTHPSNKSSEPSVQPDWRSQADGYFEGKSEWDAPVLPEAPTMIRKIISRPALIG
jgi:hypothetical protein